MWSNPVPSMIILSHEAILSYFVVRALLFFLTWKMKIFMRQTICTKQFSIMFYLFLPFPRCCIFFTYIPFM